MIPGPPLDTKVRGCSSPIVGPPVVLNVQIQPAQTLQKAQDPPWVESPRWNSRYRWPTVIALELSQGTIKNVKEEREYCRQK